MDIYSIDFLIMAFGRAGRRPIKKKKREEMSMAKKATHIERRDFIKKGLAGLAAVGAVPGAVRAAALGKATEGGPGPLAGREAAKPIIRTLGRTGLEMPVVSMGVMNADNPNLVREALDSGIVMLDTAHGYQRGRNEQMIGEVIKGRPRDSYILATKVPGSNREKGMAEHLPTSRSRASWTSST
jgi:hypothetical protein